MSKVKVVGGWEFYMSMTRLFGGIQVIRMRYGLHRQDGRGMTLQDLSAAYGLTKERIRQLEESALHKLRRHKSVLTAHLPLPSPA